MMTGLTNILIFIVPLLVGLVLIYLGWRMAGRPKLITLKSQPQTGFQPHIFHGFPSLQWFAHVIGWIVLLAGMLIVVGALFNLLVIKGSDLFY
jgi:uncharacterized membrane protein YphA (DoxX/SURF4 family)